MLVKLSSSPIEENCIPRHSMAIKTRRMCSHHVCLNMCTLQDLTRYVYCGDDDDDHDSVDDNHDFVDDDMILLMMIMILLMMMIIMILMQ